MQEAARAEEVRRAAQEGSERERELERELERQRLREVSTRVCYAYAICVWVYVCYAGGHAYERARARTRAVPTHAYVMHRLREVELCRFKGSHVALRAHTICNTQVEHTLNEQARQLACMQVCAVCAL